MAGTRRWLDSQSSENRYSKSVAVRLRVKKSGCQCYLKFDSQVFTNHFCYRE
jgi:hypothetical protein